MLNKNHLISLLVIASVALTGCNSKKSSSSGTTKTGEVIFFQNIEGTGELQLKALKTNQRNSYGKVGFQQFTNAVSLPVGTWYVNVVNDNATTDTTDDISLIDEDNFKSDSSELGLVAITEDSTGTKKLVQLPFANGAGIRPINIAHLHNGLGDLVAYFLLPDANNNDCDPAFVPDMSTPDAVITNNISFGEVSNIVNRTLPAADANGDVSKNICVYIKDDTDTLIYQSGKVALENSANQTILITRNTVAASGDAEAVNLIYYKNGVSWVWSNSPADTKAKIRVLNLLADPLEDVGFYDVAAAANTSNVIADVVSLGLSKFVDGVLPSNTGYWVEAKMMPSPMVAPFSGQQLTVMFYGDPSIGQVPKTQIVEEPLNTIDGKVRLTISTPVQLVANETSSFAIYLLKEGEYSFDSALVSLGAKSSTTVTLEPNKYQLYAMDASGSNLVKLAQYTALDLQAAGTNKHIVLYKPAGGGFDLCLIDDQACQ